jgi:hypothetical protein
MFELCVLCVDYVGEDLCCNGQFKGSTPPQVILQNLTLMNMFIARKIYKTFKNCRYFFGGPNTLAKLN